jgi:hypothetical protein
MSCDSYTRSFFTFRLRIEIDKPLIVDSLTSKPRLELSTMKQLRMYVEQLRPCPFIVCLSSFVFRRDLTH